MYQQINNILISGGWGYGNLGDSAILNSTINVIKKRYPDSLITVMTYDTTFSKNNIEDQKVILVKSIHRILVGSLAKKLFMVVKPGDKPIKNYFLTVINQRIYKYLGKLLKVLVICKYKIFKLYPALLSNYEFFMHTDLFIMSGGGYINSWKNSVYAHILEIFIARKLEKQSIFWGQSIGPFKSKSEKALALNYIKLFSLVCVRDYDTHEDLIEFNINNRVLPDIALSESEVLDGENKNIIIVINKRVNHEVINKIVASFRYLKGKIKYDIKILVTRLWLLDIYNSQILKTKLEELNNYNVQFIIPGNVFELQQEINKGSLMISTNLHGLIMAWRAGIPCISLSKERKFRSVMTQTHQDDRIIDLRELDKVNFSAILLNTLYSNNLNNNNNVEFAESVLDEYIKCLPESSHQF